MAKKAETYTEEEYGVVRESDGAFIPRDPDNRDYAEYLKQKEGEEK